MRKLGKAEIGNDLFADLMRACGRSFHLFGKQGLGKTLFTSVLIYLIKY